MIYDTCIGYIINESVAIQNIFQCWALNGEQVVHNRDVPSINRQSNRQGCFLGETIPLHVNDWGRQSC